MSVNKVILLGNCVADPTIKDFNGNKMATFRLATSERIKKQDGTYSESSEFHSIQTWRKLAEVVEKYIHKGTQVFIEGKIHTREYTDKEGNKRFATEIVADTLQLLSRRDSNDGSRPSTTPLNNPKDEEDDGLPF